MNTKNVPAIVMLIAGFVDCIFAICQHLALAEFTKQLLLVLVIFLIIGCGVKLVLDRFFDEKEPEEKQENESEKPENEGKTEESEEGPGEEQKK